MAASNSRALAFGAATAAAATIGVIAGDYVRDQIKMADNSMVSEEVLVVPNKTHIANAPFYNFEAV